MTDFLNLNHENILHRPSYSRTNSGRFTDLDPDKLRGGYYTSINVARWLCSWAIRSADDFVLEPSCGDGVFLEAAVNQLGALSKNGDVPINRLSGIEIVSDEAEKARARLVHKLGSSAIDVIETGDFFAWWKRPERSLYDVVIGNPPFIRYQSFPEPYRNRAMGIMKELGLTPNRLTNVWVPFVVAAATALKPGGRLALVLPAELLQVSYAAQLRSFLTDRFKRIHLIACNELFFERAEQEVLLLLADDARPLPAKSNSCQVALTEANTMVDVLEKTHEQVLKEATPKMICHDNEKWLKYFLSASEIELMRELRESTVTSTISDFASVNVGVVTGKNQFFVLRQSELQKRNLQDYSLPLISRTAHLIGAQIGENDWEQLVKHDELVNLLHLTPINGTELKGSLESYIAFGEEQNVHKGYKCSIRDPWYVVPSVWIPHAFMFRQIYDFPRVILNNTNATSTDTIHRMRCYVNPSLVVVNTYTSLTAASSEIEGRSYGGGVLELEPTEAQRLMMPANLGPALPLDECDRLVRDGRLIEVLDQNDRIVLRESMGLSVNECQTLRRIWQKMKDRRNARRRNMRSRFS